MCRIISPSPVCQHIYAERRARAFWSIGVLLGYAGNRQNDEDAEVDRTEPRPDRTVAHRVVSVAFPVRGLPNKSRHSSPLPRCLLGSKKWRVGQHVCSLLESILRICRWCPAIALVVDPHAPKWLGSSLHVCRRLVARRLRTGRGRCSATPIAHRDGPHHVVTGLTHMGTDVGTLATGPSCPSASQGCCGTSPVIAASARVRSSAISPRCAASCSTR